MRLGSEKRSLRRIRKGRREAYEQIIRQNYESIYRLMVYLTRDTTLAEDLTQETFTSAWARIGNFKAKASIRTWLHKIAYNKFIDSRRASSRRTNLLTTLNRPGRDSAQNVNPCEHSISKEDTTILCEALAGLDSPDYDVIVLHYINGLSFRDIAAILDSPVGTVKWRTRRALTKLKTNLNNRVSQ